MWRGVIETGPQLQARPGDWRSHLVVCVLVLILASLGVWQIARLQQKQDLLRSIDENISLPPVALATLAPGSGATAEYRPVHVRGIFLPDNFRIMSRVHDGRLGVHILTPLRRSDTGDYILVDRGWAPADWREPVLPPRPVEIVGLLRSYRPASLLTADNAPAKNEWYWIDREAISEVSGASMTDEFYLTAMPVDALGNGAYPIAQLPRLNISNNHLQYSLTWFALAVALAVIYILVLRQRRSTPPLP